MQSVETQPWAQPHILSVPRTAPRLLPCVSAKGERGQKRRKRDREGEVERLKSQRTWIGGDQRWCWTVERICVTAISKTITPVAPTRGTRNLLLRTDLVHFTLSQRTPLCCGGRAHLTPPVPTQQAAFTASCSRYKFFIKRHELSPAHTSSQGSVFLSLWHTKDFCGAVRI